MKTNFSLIAGLLVWTALSGVAQPTPPPRPGPGIDPVTGLPQPGATQTFNDTAGENNAPAGKAGLYRKTNILPAPPKPEAGMTIITSSAPAGRGYGIWAASTRGGDGPVSIISFKERDQHWMDETAEDLNIMSLLLSQTLEHMSGNDADDYKLGIPILLKGGGRAIEASYIEGFGAVFNVKVNFPLLASIEKETPKNTESPSDWERARQALAGTGAPSAPAWAGNPFEQGQPYDAHQIEVLKRKVIEVLRNASNLRHVQQNESIVVVFNGRPSESDRTGADSSVATEGVGSPEDQATEAMRRAANADRRGNQQPERATIMTIRIIKGNADSFAKKQISEDKFFHAGEVTTYLGPEVEPVNDFARANRYYQNFMSTFEKK
jgi:hypothetical protein